MPCGMQVDQAEATVRVGDLDLREPGRVLERTTRGRGVVDQCPDRRRAEVDPDVAGVATASEVVEPGVAGEHVADPGGTCRPVGHDRRCVADRGLLGGELRDPADAGAERLDLAEQTVVAGPLVVGEVAVVGLGGVHDAPGLGDERGRLAAQLDLSRVHQGPLSAGHGRKPDRRTPSGWMPGVRWPAVDRRDGAASGSDEGERSQIGAQREQRRGRGRPGLVQQG